MVVLVKGHSFIGGGLLVTPYANAADAQDDGHSLYGSNACDSGSGTVFTSAWWCSDASTRFMGGYHAPVPGAGGSTSDSNYWFQFRRSGSALTAKYFAGSAQPAPGSHWWTPWVTGGGSMTVNADDKGMCIALTAHTPVQIARTRTRTHTRTWN